MDVRRGTSPHPPSLTFASPTYVDCKVHSGMLQMHPGNLPSADDLGTERDVRKQNVVFLNMVVTLLNGEDTKVSLWLQSQTI